MERKESITIDLMLIIGKYFESAHDFVNLILVNSRYKDICAMYFYNPISDTTLFPKLKTQHFYKEDDMKYQIRGLFKYIFWNEVDQLTFLKRKENEVYKNVVLINYAYWRKNNNGVLVSDNFFNGYEDIDLESESESDENSCDEKHFSREPIKIKNGLCVVPEGITKLGAYCLSDCNITKLILPTTLKSIERNAFQFNNIQDITIPEGVTRLGQSIFTECWKLRNVSLPSTLKIIDDWCFHLVNLKTLKVPESVISIGDDSFNGINNVILPDHLKNTS